MSKFKEDIIEAKERMEAWWDHEIIDRPYIGFWVPKEGKKIPKENPEKNQGAGKSIVMDLFDRPESLDHFY
ncbi:MAG: hypothetical protein ACTSXH_12745 [Promethearchaeota archaeon]